MTRTFDLRRNISVSVLAFVINLALVFISYRLVIATGGLAVLGLWSTLTAWIFLIRLGDVGMTNATLRFVASCDTASEGRRIRTYVDTALFLNGGLFTLLALVGYAALRSQIENIVPSDASARETARTILLPMLGAFVMSNLSGLIVGALRGVHKGYLGAWLTIAGSLAQLATVMVLVPRFGLLGLAIGQMAQHGLTLLLCWAVLLVTLKRTAGYAGAVLPVNVSVATLREMFGFSLKAQCASLANGLFEPLSKLLVGRFVGLEVLGLYEMAFKLVSLPRNAVVSGVHATTPALTRLLQTDPQGARSLYEESFRLVMRSSAIVLSLVVVISPVISYAMIGDVVPRFSLFVALLSAGFMGNVNGAPAFILGMAQGSLRANIVSALLALGLMGSLAALAGATGRPALIVAAVSLALALSAYYVRHQNEKLLGEDV